MWRRPRRSMVIWTKASARRAAWRSRYDPQPVVPVWFLGSWTLATETKWLQAAPLVFGLLYTILHQVSFLVFVVCFQSLGEAASGPCNICQSCFWSSCTLHHSKRSSHTWFFKVTQTKISWWFGREKPPVTRDPPVRSQTEEAGTWPSSIELAPRAAGPTIQLVADSRSANLALPISAAHIPEA